MNTTYDTNNSWQKHAVNQAITAKDKNMSRTPTMSTQHTQDEARVYLTN